MSKVNNITKCIIPCLNNIFNEQLKHVSNAWYLDNNQNLYKIMLYEDGYLISSDSEYPEEIDELPNDNIFKSIKIYLNKVNRREYVSNKESIFKFSFVLKNNVYHYIFNNILKEDTIFNKIQIDSRKGKEVIPKKKI